MKNNSGKKLPTLFVGCMWDAHWEFDAPCVLYYPVKMYSKGGNSGAIDYMVEEYCSAISTGIKPVLFDEQDNDEFEWRGWSIKNVSKRKNAWHIVIRGKWIKEDGMMIFSTTSRKEYWGPPKNLRLRNESLRRAKEIISQALGENLTGDL